MKLKKIFLFFILTTAISTLFAQAVFNDNLSSDEQQKLANGEILIRNIGNAKKMALNPVTQDAETLLETVKKLRPAYLAEVIQIRSANTNDDLIKAISDLLLDIQGYVGIPYWSERHQTYYDLYSAATVNSSTINENNGKMNVTFQMEPFGEPHMEIDFSRNDENLFYTMKNLDNLRYYDRFTAVQKNNMLSIVYVFKHNGSFILYGVGAVKAPSVFFLRDRIETSFINRIKTFCTYLFEKS